MKRRGIFGALVAGLAATLWPRKAEADDGPRFPKPGWCRKDLVFLGDYHGNDLWGAPDLEGDSIVFMVVKFGPGKRDGCSDVVLVDGGGLRTTWQAEVSRRMIDRGLVKPGADEGTFAKNPPRGLRYWTTPPAQIAPGTALVYDGAGNVKPVEL